MSTAMMPSPLRRAKSPDISVTSAYDDQASTSQTSSPTDQLSPSMLVPPNVGRPEVSDGERSERYFTASSGEECYEDDDDDDDGMYIMLNSDSDNDGPSLRISLETAKKVSSLFAGYSRIIQRDMNGNPIFIAPPPPPTDDDFRKSSPHGSANATQTPTPKPRMFSEQSQASTVTADEDDVDLEEVLKQFDETIFQVDQDESLFSDHMSELTAVMEKMTNTPGDGNY